MQASILLNIIACVCLQCMYVQCTYSMCIILSYGPILSQSSQGTIPIELHNFKQHFDLISMHFFGPNRVSISLLYVHRYVSTYYFEQCTYST